MNSAYTHTKVQLTSLYHVPHLFQNLLSVHKLATDSHYSIAFDAREYHIKDLHNNQIILHGPSCNGLYPSRPLPKPPAESLVTAQSCILEICTLALIFGASFCYYLYSVSFLYIICEESQQKFYMQYL